MPGKTARALCPVCQEPMPPDETECANCGAFVIDEAVVRLCRAFGIDREKALALFEKGYRHPKQLQDRDLDSVLERNENGLLYLCTNCGGFVATGDTRCARCGAEFEPGAEDDASPEEDILDLVLCPVCGADNEPSQAECEICGEDLRASGTPPAPVSASVTASAPRQDPDPVRCPACGTAKADARGPCPECDRPGGHPGLVDVDAFLGDPETSAQGQAEPAPAPRVQAPRPVPRVAKVAKVARPPPRTPRGPTPGAPAPKQRNPAAPRTLPRPMPVPAPRPTPVPSRPRPPIVGAPQPAPRPDRPRRVRWPTLPPELSASLVAASGVALLSATFLGQAGVIWAVAVILASLCVYVPAVAPFSRSARLGPVDAILLALGAIPGLLVPSVPVGWALLVAVAGAPALALATRRLVRSPLRHLIVVAASLPLLSMALVAAGGLAFAGTSAWALTVLACLPWPVVLAAQELIRRRFDVAARRELSRAESSFSRRDYKESLRDYDRAIELSGKGTGPEALPWYGKGATLVLLGRYDEALRAIDTALDLNPHNEVAWLNKGNALMKLGRHLDALRCFNAALKVNPRYEVAWNNKGNALARLGHLDEALRCYDRATGVDPGYRGAWINKGYVLTKLGRYDEASSCADRAVRLDAGPHTDAA